MDDGYEMITPDTFWNLMDEAREHSGGDQAAFVDWLENQLLFLGGAEEIQNFQNLMDAYMEIADRNETRNVVTTVRGSCSDAEFYNFRAWLIAQGKEIYMSALRNPGTLSAMIPYADCSFPRLTRVGKTAFAHMTGHPFQSGMDTGRYQTLAEELRRDVTPDRNAVTEVSPDTFWTLLAEAKNVCGPDLNAAAKWLEEQLLAMEPRQAQNFHDIFHAYLDLSEKYGLWTAAAVMEQGCSDDGFIDFRAWLISQGKETYLAALRDPDSLAALPHCADCSFEALCYVGYAAYEKLTGRNAYDGTDRTAFRTLTAELRREIVYGEGIGYPYEWKDVAAYLPNLCAKYLSPETLEKLVRDGKPMWNPDSREIREARDTASKHSRVRRGDAR